MSTLLGRLAEAQSLHRCGGDAGRSHLLEAEFGVSVEVSTDGDQIGRERSGAFEKVQGYQVRVDVLWLLMEKYEG